MVSPDVKANKKTRDEILGGYYLTKIFLQNLKYNVQRACIFQLVLVGRYSIHLDIVH